MRNDLGIDDEIIPPNDNQNVSDTDWDGNDDLPLSTFVSNSAVVWTQNASLYPQPSEFLENYRSNIVT